MQHSDRLNAGIEHDRALQRVIFWLLADDTELFRQFSDNPGFKQWLGRTIVPVSYTAQETSSM